MNPTELKHFVAMLREKKKIVLLVAFSNFMESYFFLVTFKFNYNHIIHSRYMYYQKYGKQFSHFFAKLLTGAVVKIFAGT